MIDVSIEGDYAEVVLNAPASSTHWMKTPWTSLMLPTRRPKKQECVHCCCAEMAARFVPAGTSQLWTPRATTL